MEENFPINEIDGLVDENDQEMTFLPKQDRIIKPDPNLKVEVVGVFDAGKAVNEYTNTAKENVRQQLGVGVGSSWISLRDRVRNYDLPIDAVRSMEDSPEKKSPTIQCCKNTTAKNKNEFSSCVRNSRASSY